MYLVCAWDDWMQNIRSGCHSYCIDGWPFTISQQAFNVYTTCGEVNPSWALVICRITVIIYGFWWLDIIADSSQAINSLSFYSSWFVQLKGCSRFTFSFVSTSMFVCQWWCKRKAPILGINTCLTLRAMLNLKVDGNASVTSERISKA